MRVLCTVVITSLVATLLLADRQQERLDEAVEFAYPQVQADYWPVFAKDPYEVAKGTPMMDLVLDRNGKVILIDVLSSGLGPVENLLKMSAAAGVYRPSRMQGSPSVGFLRYPLQSYFVLDSTYTHHLTKLPQSNFLMARDVMDALAILSSDKNAWQLRFNLEINEQGYIESVEELTTSYKPLEKAVFEQIRDSIRFQPAEYNGEPVSVRLVMVTVVNADQYTSTMTQVANKFRINSKPMPKKPASGVRAGEEFAVDLSFYDSGAVRSIAIASPMSDELAIEAMKAFRRWRIPLSELNEISGSARVTFAYTKEDQEAVLREIDPAAAFRPPEAIEQRPPVYPGSQRLNRRYGFAVVEFAVDQRGEVIHPYALFSSEAMATFSSKTAFSDAALDAVSRWKYSPAMAGGKSVTTRMRVALPFDPDE